MRVASRGTQRISPVYRAGAMSVQPQMRGNAPRREPPGPSCRGIKATPLPPLSGGYKKANRSRRAEGVLLFLAPLTRGGRGGWFSSREKTTGTGDAKEPHPEQARRAVSRERPLDRLRTGPSIRGFAATQGEEGGGDGGACPELVEGPLLSVRSIGQRRSLPRAKSRERLLRMRVRGDRGGTHPPPTGPIKKPLRAVLE